MDHPTESNRQLESTTASPAAKTTVRTSETISVTSIKNSEKKKKTTTTTTTTTTSTTPTGVTSTETTVQSVVVKSLPEEAVPSITEVSKQTEAIAKSLSSEPVSEKTIEPASEAQQTQTLAQEMITNVEASPLVTAIQHIVENLGANELDLNVVKAVSSVLVKRIEEAQLVSNESPKEMTSSSLSTTTTIVVSQDEPSPAKRTSELITIDENNIKQAQQPQEQQQSSVVNNNETKNEIIVEETTTNLSVSEVTTQRAIELAASNTQLNMLDGGDHPDENKNKNDNSTDKTDVVVDESTKTVVLEETLTMQQSTSSSTTTLASSEIGSNEQPVNNNTSENTSKQQDLIDNTNIDDTSCVNDISSQSLSNNQVKTGDVSGVDLPVEATIASIPSPSPTSMPTQNPPNPPTSPNNLDVINTNPTSTSTISSTSGSSGCFNSITNSSGSSSSCTSTSTTNTADGTTIDDSSISSNMSTIECESPGGGRTKTKNELAAGYGFNEDQIGVFEETFQIFDKDCDGFITLVEIRTVMNALGFFPCDEIIRKSIQNIDSDNSGTVDFEEFICMMSKFRKIKTSSELDDELLEIFQIFDRNQDGFIDKEELKDVLLRLGENITDDEVAEMIKEADTDGDNKVSFTEFRSILHDNRTLAKT